MKKIFLVSLLLIQGLVVFAQTDTTGNAGSATAAETNKIDQIAKLTDSQKADVTKYLKEYYEHIDDLQKAKEDLQKIKDNIKMLSALIKGEELGFNDNLKDVLTKRQYDKCSEYLKERENKAKKKYGEPTKKVAKSHPKVNQGS
ncbi:MAG: hypothetical protein H6Q17_2345 [Bacteroidetes bacterium]|jgi:hypothetical protein|nr:hypothetical protein [Bacteroidota bacterium]